MTTAITKYIAQIRAGEITSFQNFAEMCIQEFVINKLPNLLDGLSHEIAWEIQRRSVLAQEKECRQELARLKSKSEVELWELHIKGVRALIRCLQRELKEAERGVERLTGMLKQANAFTPPTKHHNSFKDHICKALSRNIGYDRLRLEDINRQIKDLRQGIKAGAPANYKKILIENQKKQLACVKQESVKDFVSGQLWCDELLQALRKHGEK